MLRYILHICWKVFNFDFRMPSWVGRKNWLDEALEASERGEALDDTLVAKIEPLIIKCGYYAKISAVGALAGLATVKWIYDLLPMGSRHAQFFVLGALLQVILLVCICSLSCYGLMSRRHHIIKALSRVE